MPEKRSFTVPIVATLLLLLLLGLYVGSYNAMVEQGGITIEDGIVRRLPEYSIGGDATKALFLPVHCIDLWVRPKYWIVGPRQQTVGVKYFAPAPAKSPSADVTADSLE